MMRRIVITLYVALLLLGSAWSAWWLSASVNYGFSWFYNVADIGETVIRFGPQNRFKLDFALTDRAEHERLFGQIAGAINNGGAGLSAMVYRTPDGRVIDTLLRPAEVQHLQDVADLIDRLRVMALFSGLGAVVLLGLAATRKWRLPSLGRMIAGTVVSAAALCLGVALYGAQRLFYAWHTVVFPEGHQWFFYYQDSLMTTLMRAPVIFGYVGGVLAVLAVVLFVASLWLSSLILRRASMRQ